MPIEVKSTHTRSFFYRSFSWLRELFAPRAALPRLTATAHSAFEPASHAPFDPQIARRMAQLESELTRLAESQYAAREERQKLAAEVEYLREAARLEENRVSAPEELGLPPAPKKSEWTRDH